MKSGLLSLALISASCALAQPSKSEASLQSEQISFADLDLGSDHGQAVLRHRIQLAAGHVCDNGGMLAMEDFLVTTQCYRQSYRDGVRQMDRVVAANRTGTVFAASAIVVSAK